MEKCAHLLVSKPEDLRGRWLGVSGYDEMHIELGCGKGRFTVEAAMAAPRVLMVALEKSANVIVIALERAAREGGYQNDERREGSEPTPRECVQNVRFINALADDLTDFFAPGEASRIYINFCDPWPAKKHAKRRLTGQRFLELYKQVLRPGGEIHFKTDNLPLFEFSLSELERCGFDLLSVSRDLHKDGPVGIMTDYEMKFVEQGLPIYGARFAKRNDAVVQNQHRALGPGSELV